MTDLDQTGERALVAQVVDYAIFGLDTGGHVSSWNAGARLLQGWDAEEVVGRSLSTFYTPEDRAAGLPERLLTRAREEGSVRDAGWRVRKDGSRFRADAVITALHDDTGALTGYGEVTRELSDERAANLELEASEELFRLLVEQVVDYAIIGLDVRGRITTWNAGAASLKGWSTEEAVGQHFSLLYPGADRAAGLPEELLARAAADGRAEHRGWRVRKDGSRFWGDIVITAVHDGSGRLAGYTKVTRDLTDQQRLEEARTSFLAGISHDFRTPLTAIRGFAQVLTRTTPDDERGRDLAQRIVANAERLSGMVDQLVAHTRLRAGAVQIDPRPLDLAALARDVASELEAALDDHQVRVAGAGPAVALADEAAMRRVLQNLLGNAVAYSPAGTVIEVTVGPVAGEPRVRAEVADRGRGIDPDDVEVVLGEYERGRRGEADGGTGLGLAVVRQLLELQGGCVALRPREGGGTVVEVRLPVA
jgi:PAS domain S-box-containing protein